MQRSVSNPAKPKYLYDRREAVTARIASVADECRSAPIRCDRSHNACIRTNR